MATEPRLLHVIDGFVPAELHAAVWAVCAEKRWYFGHQSNPGEAGLPFWKMDLDGVDVVDRMWEATKAACEGVAGHPLQVVRQYANGHTYGLGGRPHVDDAREGCVTLLYYPMPVWLPEWEGETLFFDPRGNVRAGIAPVPNRAVLFDSRLLHSGRAPSRHCAGLRVTIALKLEPPPAPP
jgi:SM-20-related protein